jgi:hypothetical protein
MAQLAAKRRSGHRRRGEKGERGDRERRSARASRSGSGVRGGDGKSRWQQRRCPCASRHATQRELVCCAHTIRCAGFPSVPINAKNTMTSDAVVSEIESVPISRAFRRSCEMINSDPAARVMQARAASCAGTRNVGTFAPAATCARSPSNRYTVMSGAPSARAIGGAITHATPNAATKTASAADVIPPHPLDLGIHGGGYDRDTCQSLPYTLPTHTGGQQEAPGLYPTYPRQDL